MYRPPPPTLDPSVLSARLAEAQAAYHALMTGQNTTVVSYGFGDGQRSVTYTRTSLKDLRAYIMELQQQLGFRSRRAIGVRF